MIDRYIFHFVVSSCLVYLTLTLKSRKEVAAGGFFVMSFVGWQSSILKFLLKPESESRKNSDFKIRNWILILKVGSGRSLSCFS